MDGAASLPGRFLRVDPKTVDPVSPLKRALSRRSLLTGAERYHGCTGVGRRSGRPRPRSLFLLEVLLSALNVLNLRQQLFCREYVIDYHGTHAALRAGYASKGAHVQSTYLLKNPKVQAALAELDADKLAELDAQHGRIVAELAAVGFVDPTVLIDENGDLRPLDSLPADVRRSIAGLEVVETWVGDAENGQIVRVHKIRFHPKLKALELLGKRARLWDQDPAQVNINMAGPTGANVPPRADNYEEWRGQNELAPELPDYSQN